MSMAVSKIGAERNQKALSELAMKPGNGEHFLYYMDKFPLSPRPSWLRHDDK